MLTRNGSLFLVLALASTSISLAADPVKPEAPPDDPLLSLNASFRKAHAAARKEMLAKCGPVVLLDGDNLILMHDRNRIEARGIPEIYHTLKAVAHAPVAVQVLLRPYGEAALGAERLSGL